MKKSKIPSKKQQAKVIALMEAFEYLFSVNNYKRSIAYAESDINDGDVAADVDINLPYQRIHINIYPAFWEQKREIQRENLLHEFCHAIPKPLQDVVCDLQNGKLRTVQDRKDAVEQVTSRIAQLLDAQLRGRNLYARKAYEKYLK